MECVDDIFGIVLDDIGVGKDGDPVSTFSLGRLDSVDRETSRKTSDTTEYGLERLGQVVRDVVFKHCC